MARFSLTEPPELQIINHPLSISSQAADHDPAAAAAVKGIADG